MDAKDKKEALRKARELEEHAKALLTTGELKEMDEEFREEAKEIEEGIAGKSHRKKKA